MPPAGPDARQRRPRQGPVRRRARRDASPGTAASRRLRRRPGDRRRRPASRALIEVESPFDGERAPHVLDAGARRRRHERHRPAQLAGRRRAPRPPPARPRDRAARVHRRASRPPRSRRARVLAEIHAKAAVLSGPASAPGLAALGRRARVRRRLPPLAVVEHALRRGTRPSRSRRARAAAGWRRRSGCRTTAPLPARSSAPPSPKAAASSGVSSSAGSGREKKKPWPIGAARARPGTRASPRSRCPRRRPSGRGCARGRSSSARSPGRGRSSRMSVTNERSIFSSVAGSSARYSIEALPVPKSSIAHAHAHLRAAPRARARRGRGPPSRRSR